MRLDCQSKGMERQRRVRREHLYILNVISVYEFMSSAVQQTRQQFVIIIIIRFKMFTVNIRYIQLYIIIPRSITRSLQPQLARSLSLFNSAKKFLRTLFLLY